MTADASKHRWGDLRLRVVSGIVLGVIGVAAIWAGGWNFVALAVLACGLMGWELARMTALPGAVPAMAVGAVTAAALLAMQVLPVWLGLILLAAPAALGLAGPRRDRLLFALYALLIMLTGFGLVTLRESFGVWMIFWLVACVVVSDIAGYFAGRHFGGPKFWPSISPKKTWSGTIAGWAGALLVGCVFWLSGQGAAALVWLSPLVAFAGQMGDIAESALKRRAGIKDASNLIPGHGGVMDRFDALAGAVLVVTVLVHLVPLGGL